MSTKTRQLRSQTICISCSQPILPGPEFATESEAGIHRCCLHRDVHQIGIASQAHDIWLDAYSMLCRSMPQPLTEVIELFKRYWIPGNVTIHDYIKCLDHVMRLVEQSTLPVSGKTALKEKVRDLQNRIRQLTAADAN